MANEFIAKKGLGIGNLVSTLLKVNASGIVVAAVPGTDYLSTITLTTTGNSGAATFSSGTLNIPNYTLAGLGGQPQLNGTGFVKISGTTISYDNSTYYLASNPNGYTSNTGTVTSVATSGGYGGLTLTGGTITTSGTITLGGTPTGTWPISVTGNAATATYATTLYSNDVRTISPSSATAYRATYGFTSWGNNNTSPYADYLHFRGYSDASGGADNLIMFRKDAIGMRIWQQSYGSTTAYSNYVDVLHSSNYTSYALPLSGGSLSGAITFSNLSGGIRVTSSGTATTQAAIALQQVTAEGDTIIFADYEPFAEYGIIARNSLDAIDFTSGTTSGQLDSYSITNRSGSSRTAYVKMRVGLASGNVIMGGNLTVNGVLQQGGNQVLHAGNYTSYAIPKNTTNGTPIAAYYLTSAGNSGGIKVRLPFNTNSDKMVSFILRVYQSYQTYDIQFSGYLYGTINQWYTPRAVGVALSTTTTARMGRDSDGRAYVWISGGDYTGAAVFDVVGGYQTADWNTGWEIVRSDTTPNLALDTTVYPNITTGNYSSYALPLTGGTLSGNISAANITTGVNANHIVQRDASGYIYANHINFSTPESENPTINSFFVSNGDGWSRKASVAHVKNTIRGVADGTWGINVTGTAGGVAWGNISSRPDWMTSASLIGVHLNANEWRNSGFYENSGGGSNWPGSTWYNSINVRHSNQGNYHGFQVAMSYYDNNLWFRSYQGSGTFQSWAVALSNQNFTTYIDAPNKAGTSYYQTNTWMQFNGSYGLYWPSTYGAHFSPNDLSTYCQFALRGSKNTYGGIYDQYSAVNGIMYDSGGNGGVYREANGRWYWYYHLGNACMGVNTSTTSSSYAMYVNGNVYATGDITAYSDRRKKTNIVTIDNALDKVSQLRGVFYDKIDEVEKGRQTGVIAQEINEVLPEVVTYAADVDEYGVKYGNIVGVLIEAIKEQTSIIDNLKQRILQLENR